MAGSKYEKAKVIKLPPVKNTKQGWGQPLEKPERWGLQFEDGSIIDDDIHWNNISPTSGLHVRVVVSCRSAVHVG